jgi:hypothetical protein
MQKQDKMYAADFFGFSGEKKTTKQTHLNLSKKILLIIYINLGIDFLYLFI